MKFTSEQRRVEQPARRVRIGRAKLLAIPAAVALSLCGCQPAPTAAPGSPISATVAEPRESANQSAASPNQTVSPDQILKTDPSEIRLGDICEALMMYYSINHTMPPRLDDVQSATTEQLNFTSPSSGQPYGYSPEGLVAGSGPKRVYVYDPTPDSSGNRWCVEGLPPQPNAALWMETVQMPESSFKLYAPAK